MKMVITVYLSDRSVITFIQTINKNNSRSEFQSEQICGLLQGVINGTGIKQSYNSNRKVKYLRDKNIIINLIFFHTILMFHEASPCI